MTQLDNYLLKQAPFTTPTISVSLTLRLPSWACLRTRTTVPFRLIRQSRVMMSSAATTPQLSENSDLIASLNGLPKKLVKSSTYPAPADPSIQVRSWRMNEFKYYDVPSPFPTLARGLFTTEREIPDNSQEGKTKKIYEIVARGYDKFFNIGEVPWTTVRFFMIFLPIIFVIDFISQWLSIEKHSTAPYTLSLKSNGCIIFIAALTPTKILITSKHSIGPVAGSEVSHAQAGEKWLRKYLENKGKTEADLATRLWESNLTAIAEVISKKTLLFKNFFNLLLLVM